MLGKQHQRQTENKSKFRKTQFGTRGVYRLQNKNLFITSSYKITSYLECRLELACLKLNPRSLLGKTVKGFSYFPGDGLEGRLSVVSLN